MENIYEKFLESSGVSIDSRNCPKDAMFVGIKGANFDGNLFVEKALELGCKYAMITDGIYVDVAYYEKENDFLTSISKLPEYNDMLNGLYDEISDSKFFLLIPFA